MPFFLIESWNSNNFQNNIFNSFIMLVIPGIINMLSFNRRE